MLVHRTKTSTPLEHGVAISSGTSPLRMLSNLHLPWQMVKFTREETTGTFTASTLTRVTSSGKHLSTATCPTPLDRSCLNLHQRYLEAKFTLGHWTATCTPLTQTTAISTGNSRPKDQSFLPQRLLMAQFISLPKNPRQVLCTILMPTLGL